MEIVVAVEMSKGSGSSVIYTYVQYQKGVVKLQPREPFLAWPWRYSMCSKAICRGKQRERWQYPRHDELGRAQAKRPSRRRGERTHSGCPGRALTCQRIRARLAQFALVGAVRSHNAESR